jgi:hypothetical protein
MDPATRGQASPSVHDRLRLASIRNAATSERAVGALGVVAMLAVALGLRLAYLGNAQLFRDEATSWYLASHSLADIFRLGAQETYPPLYLVLLKGWMGIFGSSETALRSLSVVAGVGVVIVTWRWVRDALGATEAWLAGLLVAVSPLLIANSRNARMYSLETLFATTAWWLIWLLVALGGEWTGRKRAALAAGIAVSVAGEVWSLSLGLPSAGLQLLFVGIAVLWLRSRSSLLAGGSVAVGLLAFVPWLPNLVAAGTNGRPFWTPTPSLGALPATFQTWFAGQGGGTGAWIWSGAIAAMALIGLAAMLRIDRPRRDDVGVAEAEAAVRRRGRLLALALVLSFSLIPAVWVYSQIHSIYDGRYLANAFPAFAIAVAIGAAAVSRRLRGRSRRLRFGQAGVLACFVALVLVASGSTSVRLVANARDDASVDAGRQMAQELASVVQPGDVVVATTAETFFPLSYYLYETGEAQRLGITLFDWHAPTAAVFTGWMVIDSDRRIEPPAVARVGWRAAVGLPQGRSIWVATLIDLAHDHIYFSPFDDGGLIQIDRIMVPGTGRPGQIRQAVPAGP